MFQINEDLSIYVTRGDVAFFTVSAYNDNGARYIFQKDDIVTMKVTEKKACENVIFSKDFLVTEEAAIVGIILTEEETRFGDVISKPVDYWYEVELTSGDHTQTIIGYDDEDGAKIFRLFPEAKHLAPPIEKESAFVDKEFSLTSENPLENKVITEAFNGVNKRIDDLINSVSAEGVSF